VSYAVAIVAGYLAGSIPTGYWLVRAVEHVDIRTLGSGNIGGTNVWRVYGRRLGLPVIVVDTAKGFVPALLATLLVSHLAGVLAGGAAMLGHWRPLFLGWQRGGKMVATCGGAFLGVAPVVGGIGAGVWIVSFVLFRYASVASMLAACSLPPVAVLLGEPWPVIAFAAVAAAAVIVLHRANIGRLLSGTESRFSFRRPARAG
jgi:glycerol-3-phosphate acyltransferase PlsY